MTWRKGSLLLAAFAALSLFVNHNAYGGWFQDDEIANLGWAPLLPWWAFFQATLSPLFQLNNFRPVAHFYFHAVEAAAGLNFPVYVAVLHALHFVNVGLLWQVLRKLGAPPAAAAAASLFFGLHMALFDDFWKPMYVFDVLCGMFCLASLWLWIKARWFWSFVSFWLAYKCKELAVMLPLVLLGYELSGLGGGDGENHSLKDRWKYLAPFFLVSLSFGLQGLFLNPNTDNDYTFRFSLAALKKTARFYSGYLFLKPYLWFLAPALALLARNRRVWFGLSMMLLFFFPMLFLPGRLFSAYCYVPFTGLAVALSGIPKPSVLVWLVILWQPLNLREFRGRQRETLARDAEIRTWMDATQRFVDSNQAVDAFVFSGLPARFNRWGVDGTIGYMYGNNDREICSIEEPQAREWMASKRVALIEWDSLRKVARVGVVGQH